MKLLSDYQTLINRLYANAPSWAKYKNSAQEKIQEHIGCLITVLKDIQQQYPKKSLLTLIKQSHPTSYRICCLIDTLTVLDFNDEKSWTFIANSIEHKFTKFYFFKEFKKALKENNLYIWLRNLKHSFKTKKYIIFKPENKTYLLDDFSEKFNQFYAKCLSFEEINRFFYSATNTNGCVPIKINSSTFLDKPLKLV